MHLDCGYFVEKAAAADAAPALKNFCSILHCPAALIQKFGTDPKTFILQRQGYLVTPGAPGQAVLIYFLLYFSHIALPQLIFQTSLY